MLMNNKFKAQTLTGNPTGNYRCQLFASRALNMSCYFSQSARSIESRCVVKVMNMPADGLAPDNAKSGAKPSAGKVKTIVLFVDGQAIFDAIVAKRSPLALAWKGNIQKPLQINKLKVTEGDFKSKLNLYLDAMYILAALAITPSYQQNTYVFADGRKNMNDIFNNYVCSASHMHPGLHFQNVWREPCIS